MIEVYPKQIDAKRVKRQLDKLVNAFLDASEELVERERELLKPAERAPRPTH